MPIAKTLVLRSHTIRARILTITLDLQAILVRKSSQSRLSRLSICFEYAVAGLKSLLASRTQQMIALPREADNDLSKIPRHATTVVIR